MNFPPNYSKWKYTGWALLNEIDPHAHILDIGCGSNVLKPHFPNLWGIDPYHNNADEMCKFEDYIPHRVFDIFLALGSLNFYDLEYVENQISHLTDITKTDDIVIFRQNAGDILPNFMRPPFLMHTKEKREQWYFPWSLEYNEYFTNKYNFELIEFKDEHYPKREKDLRPPKRYYAKWKRK